MIKTWYEEYEKIKDKAVVVYGCQWDSMTDEQKEKILAEKTVIMSGDSGYACQHYTRLSETQIICQTMNVP